MTTKEAKDQAKKWMKTQAALHGPDMVAGGQADNVVGVGDKRVNASIGAQWRYRIESVDLQIQEMAKTMSQEEKRTTYLNIKLEYGGMRSD